MTDIKIRTKWRIQLTLIALLVGVFGVSLGIPPVVARTMPALLLRAVQVSAGDQYTCALTNTSRLYCWGANGYGQLGDGTTLDRTTPSLVSQLSDVQSVSAGGHTCAVLTNGMLYCWGDNAAGQLGDGTRTGRTIPTLVADPSGSGGLGAIQSVSVGLLHTCAVTTAGLAYCWGENGFGQLGDGTTTGRLLPTLVRAPSGFGSLSGVKSISAVDYHTCAVLLNGQLYCWGRNQYGELGDGTFAPRSLPTLVMGLGGVQHIGAGHLHTCALDTAMQLYCWGNNAYGQLGDGTTVNRTSPVLVSDPNGAWAAVGGLQSVAAGRTHTCALTESGQAYCWGHNVWGELGDGSTTNRDMPTLVTGLGALQQISVGYSQTCAANAGGQLYCWGHNAWGALGNGSTTDQPSPVLVSDFYSPRTPVIFIPGILGSVLANTIAGQEQVVWPDVHAIADDNLDWGSPLDVLQLQPDGSTPAKNEPAYNTVHVRMSAAAGNWDGVVQQVQGNILGQVISNQVYAPLYQKFQALGYQAGVDLWAFPYDWRKAIPESSHNLAALVDQIRQQTGSTQVYLVAHSMGGLVARHYIADSNQAAKVKGLVLIGTPILGAPKTVASLQGLICTMDMDLVGYCLPRKEVVTDLIRNFPAFYALMPTTGYFQFYRGFYSAENQNLDVSQIYTNTLLGPNFQPALYTAATDFQTRLINDLTLNGQTWNNVPVTLIGGYQHQTIMQILKTTHCYVWKRLCFVSLVPHSLPIGDKTVPESSISLQNSSTNWRGQIPYYRFPYQHTELTQKEDVFSRIQCALGFACPSTLVASVTEMVNGIQIIAFGAQTIHVTDSENRHTGPTASDSTVNEEGIPGSFYQNTNDYTTVALIGGQNYTFEVQPNGVTPLDIRVIRSADDTVTETLLYTGIPASTATRIRLTGDPYLQNDWQLDVIGDGQVIQTVTPSAIFFDQQQIDTSAPDATIIQLSGTLGPQGWYEGTVLVTLTATDNPGGSGINRIEYAFSNQNQAHLYTAPFVVDAADVALLSVVAVDNAGNTQQTVSMQRVGPDKMFLPFLVR